MKVTIKNNDLYWLAGLLEGEGSFMKGPPSAPNRPVISMQMTDKDIIEKAANIIGIGYCENKSTERKGYKKCWSVRTTGSRAMSIMRQVFSIMGERRQEQITKALDSHDPNKAQIRLTEEDVKKLRKLYETGAFTQQQLADKFKIDRTTANKIIKRKKWPHIE